MQTYMLISLKGEKLRRKDIYMFTYPSKKAIEIVFLTIGTVFIKLYYLPFIILIKYRYSGHYGVQF